jgi:biopolymer transport protein ExbD
MTSLHTVAKSGTRRPLNKHLFIDMTPMVDLGFLLITFFIFTTTMGENKTTSLYMPSDGPPTPLKESTAFTLLLTKNNSVYYYSGNWANAFETNLIGKTSFDVQHGIGKFIREKQKTLGADRNELMLLIKASDEATYNDIVNALDEVMINEVKHYAIVDLLPQEKLFLAR